MTSGQLGLALQERDKGIARVSSKNGTFLETMRKVARLICRLDGQVTADDLREWADLHGIKPTHFNAWGGVFHKSEFVSVGFTKSHQVQGHGNDQTRLASGNEWQQDPAAGANWRDVWAIAADGYREAHFAVMPSKLVERCILAGSRPGDIVFDPFLGSGTTGMVAEKLGRQWIGIDIHPEYALLQKKRIYQRGFPL